MSTWFTPTMWTGYILLTDAVVARINGKSWLTSGRRELPFLALISVAVWLLFEVYNLHLNNWIYLGVPRVGWVRNLGYFWSFATIMPAVFITADFVSTLLTRSSGAPRGHATRIAVGPDWAWFLIGLTLISIPALLPTGPASYLFGAVWLGFILLLDPINERLGMPSLRAELSLGRLRPLAAYLLAGLICGLLWEAWNYQAFLADGAFWVYTFPAALQVTGLHYGQMPLVGLLGFPPFALELRAFYLLLREMLGGNRVFGETPLSP
ncbi:MAG: hypothetical protein WBR18_09520 [Anaerolineales bacterium]